MCGALLRCAPSCACYCSGGLPRRLFSNPCSDDTSCPRAPLSRIHPFHETCSGRINAKNCTVFPSHCCLPLYFGSHFAVRRATFPVPTANAKEKMAELGLRPRPVTTTRPLASGMSFATARSDHSPLLEPGPPILL